MCPNVPAAQSGDSTFGESSLKEFPKFLANYGPICLKIEELGQLLRNQANRCATSQIIHQFGNWLSSLGNDT
jgi:hypothetical protein